jgi:hypothetical protein
MAMSEWVEVKKKNVYASLLEFFIYYGVSRET